MVVAVAATDLMGAGGVIDTLVTVVVIDVVKFAMPAPLDWFSC